MRIWLKILSLSNLEFKKKKIELIKSKINLNVELPNLNKTTQSPNYEILTPKSIIKLKVLYKKDLYLFGYNLL